jgi:hypothetical protein
MYDVKQHVRCTMYDVRCKEENHRGREAQRDTSDLVDMYLPPKAVFGSRSFSEGGLCELSTPIEEFTMYDL